MQVILETKETKYSYADAERAEYSKAERGEGDDRYFTKFIKV